MENNEINSLIELMADWCDPDPREITNCEAEAWHAFEILDTCGRDILNALKRNAELEQQVLHYIAAASEESKPEEDTLTLDLWSSNPC